MTPQPSRNVSHAPSSTDLPSLRSALQILAMLVVSMPGDLSGLALYHAPFGLADEAEVRAWLPVDFAHMIVAWLAARLAIRR